MAAGGARGFSAPGQAARGPERSLKLRIPVHKQRDVISRIALHQKESSRSISEALGVAPNSVLTLRKAYEGAGLSAEVLEQLDDDQWRSKLGTADRTITRRKRAPDWEFIHRNVSMP